MTIQSSSNENFLRFGRAHFIEKNVFIKLGINSYNSVLSENMYNLPTAIGYFRLCRNCEGLMISMKVYSSLV